MTSKSIELSSVLYWKLLILLLVDLNLLQWLCQKIY